MECSEGRLEKIITFDFILRSGVLEKLKELGRDLWEEPVMLLLIREFFKDESWVNYLASRIDPNEMNSDFRRLLSGHFKVIEIVSLGPFDLAVFVDFKGGFPNEKELSKMMDDLETDVVNFLLGPKYLGKIKEQIDIFSSPFKSFVDFSIGHAFVRKADKDEIMSALNIAFKDAEVRKKLKMNELTQELLRILDRRDLETFLQPIVDLKERKILAYESLARGPEGSPLRKPELMFKIASLSGLEIELDRLARRKHLERFKSLDMGNAYFTVNLGPQTPLFIEKVDEDIKSYKIAPEKIVWEVSEKTYIDDFTAFMRAVDFLTGKGYNVAVDDFGAGATTFKLASFTNLRAIKVDRLLVKHVDEDENNQFLLYKILQCFYTPGRAIVVEGVETFNELKALVKIGYRYFQGFFFSKPSPALSKSEELGSKLSKIRIDDRKLFNAYYDF